MPTFAVALVAASCGSGGSTTTTAGGGTATTGGSTGGSQPAGGAQISIQNFSFSPASVTVKAGDTVTWTNNDSATHTVTGDKNEFNSGDVAPGATFSFTFKTAGTVDYHCAIHPSMKGTITVQ